MASNGVSAVVSESSVPNGDADRKQAKICVFCGASEGNSPAYMEAARSLATTFHKYNIHLIYGGGTVGLMGEIARTLVSLSGPSAVHGIIPDPLVKFERGPESSSQSEHSSNGTVPDPLLYGYTTVVKTMHERKEKMAQEVCAGGPGSGFIVLPGGFGTTEEAFEMTTWNQLGIQDKGIIFYNVEGFYDDIFRFVNKCVQAGFIRPGSQHIMEEGKDAEDCVGRLRGYKVKEGTFKLDWKNT